MRNAVPHNKLKPTVLQSKRQDSQGKGAWALAVSGCTGQVSQVLKASVLSALKWD